MPNGLIIDLVADELRRQTNLSDEQISHIVNSISNRLDRKRYVTVPAYLTDSMYEAVKEIEPSIEFKQANLYYRAATLAYHQSDSRLPPIDDEVGSFW